MAKPKRLSTRELEQVVDRVTECEFGISRTAAIMQGQCLTCGKRMDRKFVLREEGNAAWNGFVFDGMCVDCRASRKLQTVLGEGGAYMLKKG